MKPACWGLLLLGLVLAWSDVQAQPSCRRVLSNRKGVAKADIVVSTTAVTVADANTARCSLLIYNSSTFDMRCSDLTNDGAPTATTGVVVPAGQGRGFELEGQGQWQCIRTGTSDAAANVAEGLP